ncbi:MAG: FAD-dependent oxidoreductase [Gammaproteobacteria bacterium]|nr:FAD-dependent oxidoreductase [Gammaproteobacteria bacterium]
MVVIGAGPAGMAAAQAAAAQGVEVALVDEQAQPGGQIYRNVDSSPLASLDLLGRDYVLGKPLVQAFRHAHIDYFPKTSVWYLDKTRQLGLLQQGVHRRVHAETVVIACGAQERPMPIPGWQLPGVMTAGAGQILLKSAALVPERPPVLAGSGPLLLLLASQYLRAGVGIRAIVDTTPRLNPWRLLSRLPRALGAADYLFKGLQLLRAIKRARVPWYKQAVGLQACGDERLRSLRFECRGETQEIETDLLMLHQGVIPALQIADAACCDVDWNETQQCWQLPVDDWGESSQAGIFVAGDAAAIVGARAAALCGRLAGLQVACQLGRLDRAARDRLARPLLNARQRHLAIRPFLDTVYRIDKHLLAPDAATLVCRCEEISGAQIEAVVELGCSGPNQVKAFTRCGMGACQGRLCGASVEHILAQRRGCNVGEIGRFSVRPPLKPITLGQLAMNRGDQDDRE